MQWLVNRARSSATLEVTFTDDEARLAVPELSSGSALWAALLSLMDRSEPPPPEPPVVLEQLRRRTAEDVYEARLASWPPKT